MNDQIPPAATATRSSAPQKAVAPMTPVARALPPLTRGRAALLFGDDTGAATAEYAIATMASVADL